MYLTCTGQTTIEFHGNMTARQRAKAAGDPKWRNPYSHGTIYSNWQQVYGTGNPVWNILIPSRREPEFLPVPIPGHSSRRRTESPLARGSVADFGTPDASSAADSDELLATQV